MRNLWYVSSYLPDYPEEITEYKYSGDGRHVFFGEMLGCVADLDEIFSHKAEALEAALHGIRRRIRTMHDEGMDSHDYDRSREWADALVSAISYELESGHPVDLQELACDLHTMRRERGGVVMNYYTYAPCDAMFDALVQRGKKDVCVWIWQGWQLDTPVFGEDERDAALKRARAFSKRTKSAITLIWLSPDDNGGYWAQHESDILIADGKVYAPVGGGR